jgi:thiamine-phosphate pyrophosphorylase
MLRYAITDGLVRQHGGPDLLWQQATRWAAQGIDFIQLREKDLSSADLARVARGVLRAIEGSSTRLLLNGRADVAVAVGAHGVHLTSATDELPPAAIRAVYDSAGLPPPVVSVSVHSLAEVHRAIEDRAGLILFGPVFGKLVAGKELGRSLGIESLREACDAARGIEDTSILALGGVTRENQQSALDAGAAGIAAIRLFAGARPQTGFTTPRKS